MEQNTPPPEKPVVNANPPTSTKPVIALQKNQGSKNKRLIIGCVSALGCGLLLFLAILFIFIGFSGETENPIFGLFGISGGEVVNVVLTLTNLIFGILVFAVFIATVILAFKFAATKKTEKENRKKAGMGAFIALALLFFLIFVWIFSYLFLSSKRTIVPKNVIITEPENTIDLTAPVTVKFDASKIPVARKYKVLNYDWDFGDGTEQSGGALQTHTYESKGKRNGRFDTSVTINVIETGTNKEVSQTFTKIITITNEKADVVIKASPASGEAPLTVNFDASGTTDPDGEIQLFEWDLDEDGEYDDAKGKTAKYTFTQIGTYNIGLRVTESNGGFTTDETTVEVLPSKNPTASMVVEETDEDTLTAGVAYNFSASSSKAVEGSIERYKWNFGDGSPDKTTRRITHRFRETGSFIVTLTVTDSGGRTGTAVKEFFVQNPQGAPTAVIETAPVFVNGTVAGTVPFEVRFNASKSSDGENDIVDYEWDFDGDGNTDASDISATHTFTEIGEFRTILTVRDSTNKEGKTSVNVSAVSPGLLARITASSVSGEIPLTVNFDASGSSYAGKNITSYSWNFGDSTPAQLGTAKISHQYVQVGVFQAEVTVLGDDGNTAKAKIQINVLPVPLSACFTATPESGQVPLEVEFNPQCSTGTVTSYRWKFGEAGESRERRPRFTFENEGDYMVQLTITNNQNTVSDFVKTVRVLAP